MCARNKFAAARTSAIDFAAQGIYAARCKARTEQTMTIALYDLAAAEDDRRFSPYCWRVKMALAHKGLAFETLAWRFTEKEALAFSGSSTVPVIVDGSRHVADSWTIANYLDEAY